MLMKKISILWTDDEIDLLKPHILFLEAKGYEVETASNGEDAIELIKKQHFDIIFLDENMPGRCGLDILKEIKSIYPGIPVVMITKSEEETIMEAAIGSQISDFLIKPVNPNQILLSIKKNIEEKELITKKTTADYQAEFNRIGMSINNANTHENWIEVYRKLVFWETELEKSNDNMLDEILRQQKTEANSAFTKFIKKNYCTWFDKSNNEAPLLSHNIFRKKVFPLLDQQIKVVFLLIDNLRYDQWKIIQPNIAEYYNIDEEEIYFSILPTATQYARNTIFAGLMPTEINQIFPDIWLNDEDDGLKNEHEQALLARQLTRFNYNFPFNYEKIIQTKDGKKLIDNLSSILNNKLAVFVFNFVDMLSHARTDSKMIRELAANESAYRSLTLSWFQHSSLLELFKIVAKQNIKIILTTDHGMVRVQNPLKVIGERTTTTNLRYKQGRNLNYNPKEVFEITDPQKAHLPKTNVSSTYIFATNNDFFAYPNNYNYYVNYYKDTYQHGGVSMEEMLLPLITLSPRHT
ncbi:MAG: bifunctional response regulator/alkaline phosphatase family protein [Bacteroidia bacterium]|nr:bifunctional response regulator/alkaline phosphatase family protein [Bacteroidia bacterium]